MAAIKKSLPYKIPLRNTKSSIASLCRLSKPHNLFQTKITLKTLLLANTLHLLINKSLYSMNLSQKIHKNNITLSTINKAAYSRREASQNHLKNNKVILSTKNHNNLKNLNKNLKNLNKNLKKLNNNLKKLNNNLKKLNNIMKLKNPHMTRRTVFLLTKSQSKDNK